MSAKLKPRKKVITKKTAKMNCEQCNCPKKGSGFRERNTRTFFVTKINIKIIKKGKMSAKLKPRKKVIIKKTAKINCEQCNCQKKGFRVQREKYSYIIRNVVHYLVEEPLLFYISYIWT